MNITPIIFWGSVIIITALAIYLRTLYEKYEQEEKEIERKEREDRMNKIFDSVDEKYEIIAKIKAEENAKNNNIREENK